jgi:tetratricopeptide (TPR) repeat protein
VADPVNNLGNVAYDAGDFQRAEKLYRRALTISLATVGAEHPDTAARWFNLAAALLAQKKAAEALEDDRRALAIYEKHGGAGDQFFPLEGIGEALSAQGKWDEAAAPLERAVELGARGHVSAPELAEARFALAEVRWHAGAHAAATALAEEARAGYTGQASKQAQVARWLAAHGGEARQSPIR